MVKHKVVHFKEECISCGACAAVFPEYWEMDEDDMAQLIGSEKKGDNWEIPLRKEEDLEKNKEAADSCPVDIIHVKEIEED